MTSILQNNETWCNPSFRLKETACYAVLFILLCIGYTNALLSQSTDKPQPEDYPVITKAMKSLDITMNCNSGLSIYDVEKGEWLYQSQANEFFIPASNAKILTMYAVLHSLGNHLDAAYSLIKGDTLFIWGGGDPGTFYPKIDSASTLIQLLRNTDKIILFSDQHFQTKRYGAGWAWDDHFNSYQCERNAFPIYGNRIWIDRYGDSIVVTPSYFEPNLVVQQDTATKTTRSEWGDQYFYSYWNGSTEDHRTIPIRFYKNDLALMWAEATGKSITFKSVPFDQRARPVIGSARDTLLKIMMQVSDNFIAEQLTMASSMKTEKVMNEKIWIDSMFRGPLNFILDTLQWYDGSGLSRYNLMTPNTMVRVLNKIYEEQGLEYIQAIFPVDRAEGSLKRWFEKRKEQPFLYAKTGTMKNVMNLSGYLVTRNGKVLVFSWMNNQCIDRLTRVKDSMEKLLTFLYEEY